MIKLHFVEHDGDSENFLLKVSIFCYLPSSEAVGGSRRIYPPVPGGAERGTGGGCCLVQVASWMERKGAGEGVTGWWGHETGCFVSLSFSGNRITVDCTEGQGRSGSEGNRERMINSWRQERKTEMLRQTGKDKIKTIYLQLSPDIFLIMWWAFCFAFFLPCRSWVGFAPCLIRGVSRSHTSPGTDPLLPLAQCSSPCLTPVGVAPLTADCNWELVSHSKRRKAVWEFVTLKYWNVT